MLVARWAEIQGRLGTALAANRRGSAVPHVLVALPSFSLGESLLAHYGPRLPALEHRYLLAIPILATTPGCELVFTCSVAPDPEVLDDAFSVLPEHLREDCRRRFRVVAVDDSSPRSVATKLGERPDLVEDIRAQVAGRPALVEPWNVTAEEVRLVEALDVPVNGTTPDLWHLGFKTDGRRLLRDAGVPVPEGAEDLHSVRDLAAAADRIRRVRPECRSVVVKTDDSAAGDGNRVVHVDDDGDLVARFADLPAWYLADVAKGAVVEEVMVGTRFASPSAQVDIRPDGAVDVVATHEQVLGGDDGQVYEGCRFPADEAYSGLLAEHARAAGHALASAGALGRVAVDFVAVEAECGHWDVRGIEVNLRKGGTTHPFAALRHLVPGHYDTGAGQWVATNGASRYYESTDNLVDDAWLGRAPSDVVEAVRTADLRFDPRTGVGVILHMLSGLAIDGRMGMTAVGSSRAHATELFAAAEASLRV